MAKGRTKKQLFAMSFETPHSALLFCFHCCSSSTRTPLQSLGWRNMTGLPWAPRIDFHVLDAEASL